MNNYGWIRQTPDHRDFKLQTNITSLPRKIDLSSKIDTIYDQGQSSSCTANAICYAYKFDQKRQFVNPSIEPSRLFVYYNERDMEDSINYDSGAQIRDGIKSLNTYGVCEEKLYPYEISRFREKPSELAYHNSNQHKSVEYYSVSQDLNSLKSALVSGLLIVFGFSVYEYFESEEVAKTGIVYMPRISESLIGGHAVCAVGYNDDTKEFKVVNSWGSNWGDRGFFYLPYDYVTNSNLASDFWVLKLIM